MSFLDRLTRAFSTLSHVELDDRAKIGALGEQYAAQVIDDSEGNWIRNPIIPHPTKPGYTLEADFLVYTRGNLFCVEIKNYKGRISYAPKYRTVQVEQRDFLGNRYVPKTVIDSYDDSRILQEKVGNYGEGIFTKEYPNPLKKTRYFLHRLKDYLSTRDARFQRLHIIPVVGFAEHAERHMEEERHFRLGMCPAIMSPRKRREPLWSTSNSSIFFGKDHRIGIRGGASNLQNARSPSTHGMRNEFYLNSNPV